MAQLSSINDADEQLISASICNECVMNVSNFFNFKKKITSAQEFLNSCSANSECTNEAQAEQLQSGDETVVEEYTISDDDIMREEHLELDEEHLFVLAADGESMSENGSGTLDAAIKAAEKRKEDKIPSHTQTKRVKVVDNSQKVTIQMNECLVCPAILGDIIELNSHVQTHQTIVCKSCNRTFARYSNLKRHFNSAHSKPKPFQCDICGIGFSFSINLQTHAEIHYAKNIRLK